MGHVARAGPWPGHGTRLNLPHGGAVRSAFKVPQRHRRISCAFAMLSVLVSLKEETPMRKLGLVLATAATLAVTAVATPSPAHARYYGHYGYGPGIVGGLVAGALIAGIASSAYGYGPGYGYYGGYGGYDYGRPYYGYGHVYAPQNYARPGGYNNPNYLGY
jgi:hypothetical protein